MNNLFLMEAAKGLDKKHRNQLYLNDPEAWAKDMLGIDVWSKQSEILHSVIDNKKTAVKSCHSTGKSFTMSLLACWWVSTRAEMDAIVVSTAPTYEQVNKILWEAIRKNHTAGNLIGTVNQQDEWKLPNGTVAGFGRKPADTSLHGFHGIHRPGGVLVLLDEGCGLHQNIFTATEAITTGALDRMVTVGNPDEANTDFGRIFLKDDPGWNKITISAYDTPNFSGEKVAPVVAASLISPEWVEDKKTSWGEGSPRWQSKIMGEFSTDTANTLFTLGDINTGKSTELAEGQESVPRLGVDVARMGEDETVVYSYHDGVVRLVDKWSKADAMESATKIVDHAWRLGVDEVRIDAVGLGGPIMDIVNSKSDARFHTIGIYGNGASPDIDKWFNYRAYMYDNVRERMHEGKIDLAFDDETLHDELLTIEYHFKNPRNSLQIEKKEEIRQRTGKSPDYADAFIYAALELPIDPSSPEAKLKIGETYQMDLDELLETWERQISPF